MTQRAAKLPLFVVLDSEQSQIGDEITGKEVVYCFPEPKSEEQGPSWLRKMLLFLALRDVSDRILGQQLVSAVFRVPFVDDELLAGEDSVTSESEAEGESRKQASRSMREERLFTIGYTPGSRFHMVVACPSSIDDDVSARSHSSRIQDAVNLICPDLEELRTNKNLSAGVAKLFSDSMNPMPVGETTTLVCDAELHIMFQSMLLEVDTMDHVWQSHDPVLTRIESPALDHCGSILLVKNAIIGSTLPQRHVQRICNFLCARGILTRGSDRAELLEFVPASLGPVLQSGEAESKDDQGIAELVLMQRYGLTYAFVAHSLPGAQPNRSAKVAAIRSVLHQCRPYAEELLRVVENQDF